MEPPDTTPARILYWVNGSISSWRVQLCLHEKGLAFEARRLRLMGGERETRTPEFLALNPRGQAPVLVDGDVVMNESLAILTYLELRYPGPSLLSRDDPTAMARTLALAQESETTASAYEPLEQLFLQADDASLTTSGRASLAAALTAVDHECSLWQARLASSPFVAGASLSLADCAFYPVLAYLQRRGLSLVRWPALAAYATRMADRPAARASHPVGWHHDRVRPDLFARARALVA